MDSDKAVCYSFSKLASERGVERKIVKELKVNTRITAREVRLISEQGEQLGIFLLSQALQIAKERGFDLVEVAPTANPPVCRLLDYGKYKYEMAKKEQKTKKGQKAYLLKEIRLRPKINEHDLEAKIKTVQRLLKEGKKVKTSIIFKGREATHPELGWKILKKVVEDLKGVAFVDHPPTEEGSAISLIFLPIQDKTKS